MELCDFGEVKKDTNSFFLAYFLANHIVCDQLWNFKEILLLKASTGK